MSVHNSLPTQMILRYGSEAQKNQFLKPMARGEILGAFALSEPDAGSDASALTAQAVKDGDHWVLNGTKAWVTNGNTAGMIMAMARTDTSGARKGGRGIGAFIITPDLPGFKVGKKEDKLGLRASPTVQLNFDNMRVPAGNLLGDETQGFIYAMQSLDNGRLGIAAQAIGIARAALEHITEELRGLEEGRLAVEHSLNPLRERITELRIREQEAATHAEQYAQQLQEAGVTREEMAEQIERRVGSKGMQAEITRLTDEIAALGPVNLAALSELNTARERKNFLDAQAADLTQAVATLESAIKRIDRETRELLQDTFEAVNRHFQEMFPALFGGGQASLKLTGEEILDAGLVVMAQPPGKKNSSIQLLSGGEKALTAIALVFSLFKLNPAPFCLLDEVDAPLDDPNTERFCELVRQMSAQTQFLFITHNKITMELASQLVGVTMPEPGVSRIVEVDIEAAMELARKQAA